MNSLDYIKKELNDLVMRFPNIKVSYQFDTFSAMHIVEVLPKNIYVSNNDYKLIESNITFSFDEIFFPESVVFISEESLVRIDKPEFQIVGFLYNIKPDVIITPKYNFVFKELPEPEKIENFALAA